MTKILTKGRFQALEEKIRKLVIKQFLSFQMNLREIGTLYVELERHWTKIQALLKLEVSFRASNYHMSLSKCT